MKFWMEGLERGQSIALSDPVLGDVSYETLAREADAWGQRYDAAARDIGPDARLLVAIEISARAPVIAAYLGALRAGHPVLLGAPGDFDADRPIARRYLPHAIVAMRGGECGLDLTGAPAADLFPDLAVLLSTSGTTGDPRLVRLSHDNLASNATAIAGYLGLGADDRAITALPLHYSYGMSVLHSHLAAGARLILAEGAVTDPAFRRRFLAERATSLALVPHQIDLLLARPDGFSGLAGLRYVTQAGGKLAPETVARAARLGRTQGWDYVVMYGQTEAAPRIAYLPPGAALTHPGSIGRAIPGGRLWIEDADGTEITEAGRAGALVYEGPNVMLGYARARPELALGRTTGTLRTGDIATRDAGGYFTIVGRESRFVKLYGLRINLDQVELSLAGAGLGGHAVAVDDRLVVLTTDAAQEAAIAAHVAAAYDLPRQDITAAHIAEVPKLASGKTDMRRIETLAREALDAVPAPSDQPLAEIFQEALRLARVRPTDSFASLGGDSLAYLHVQLALEARLGQVPQGWETMSLATLEAMPRAGKTRTSRLEAGVVLRLAAICAVVLVHLNRWPLSGGTWLLVVLMGYSMARFQRQSLAANAPFRVVQSMFYPIIPIYFLALATYHLLSRPVPPEMYLLLGNFIGRVSTPVFEPFWFISLYAQIVVVFIAMAAVPGVRRMMADRPFDFGIIATNMAIGFTILIRAAIPGTEAYSELVTEHYGLISIRTLPVCLPLALLGWTIQFADTGSRRLLCLICLCLCLPTLEFARPSYYAFVIGGTAILASGVALTLPTALSRALQRLASLTLFVYLVHNVIIHVFNYATPLKAMLGETLSAMVALPLCFLLAFVTEAVFNRADRLLRGLRLPAFVRRRA